jgi:hypothetical protein
MRNLTMTIRTASLMALLALPLVGSALADGAVGKAKDAVDPDCTATKAAKGAAMKATVGVGNRCDVGETARDVTGIDGKGKKDDGPIKKATGN